MAGQASCYLLPPGPREGGAPGGLTEGEDAPPRARLRPLRPCLHHPSHLSHSNTCHVQLSDGRLTLSLLRVVSKQREQGFGRWLKEPC